MLVQLCSHPLTSTTHLPRSAVHQIAAAVRRAGADVLEPDASLPAADLATAAASCAANLRSRWQVQRPDLVHTFGLAATMAAVEVGGVPIVATFDESPIRQQSELDLAARVTAVMPLSTAESDRWRRQGLAILSAGIFPFPVKALDLAPPGEASAPGHVVSFSDGAVLDALVAALPRWGASDLVVGTRLTPERWSVLRDRAAELGAVERVHHRPGLRGRARERMWAGAAVLVVDSDVSRHGGYVLEAAAHGVPSVGTAEDAHLDHIVAGTSGILVPSGGPDPDVARVVSGLLDDPYRLRALGLAAHARVLAAHDPHMAGERLLGLYREPLADSSGRIAALMAEGPGGLGGDDSQSPSGEHVPAAPQGASDAVDREARDALVTAHLPLARQLAGWYAGRGQAREDLVQVAYLGLVLAAERFDPAHGTAFPSFAVPTVLGELRRHFRDHAWDLRVPRAMQESVLIVRRAADDLQQALGHEPTASDLAAALDLSQDEVRTALCTARRARGADSLDHVEAERLPLAERLGAPDPGYERADVHGDVQAALRLVPPREREVLLMRFHAELTQSQIAERLGISQVHVSRLISKTLAAIRDHVLTDAPLPPAWAHTPPHEHEVGAPRRVARAS
jgi:RNA polymerase sigma-B factor